MILPNEVTVVSVMKCTQSSTHNLPRADETCLCYKFPCFTLTIQDTFIHFVLMCSDYMLCHLILFLQSLSNFQKLQRTRNTNKRAVSLEVSPAGLIIFVIILKHFMRMAQTIRCYYKHYHEMYSFKVTHSRLALCSYKEKEKHGTSTLV